MGNKPTTHSGCACDIGMKAGLRFLPLFFRGKAMPLKGAVVLGCLFFVSSVSAAQVSILAPKESPAIQFAVDDLKTALEMVDAQLPDVVVGVADERLRGNLQKHGGEPVGELVPEAYAIRVTEQNGKRTVWAIGADRVGAMYAGLELAEAIRQKGIDSIRKADRKPYVKKRGLKINVPLDARTPAYADCGDAAQQNMAVIWDLDFWKALLDRMARYRYDTITLWNQHPFPSMVKVADYPDVALDDVMVADIDWNEWFSKNAGHGGARGVTPDILANLKLVKKMTIEEKIAHWQAVMQYAHDRGIEVHIITWNIFTWAAEGKYGITPKVDNEVTIDYLRKSVRALFETYPLLAGIGTTAGERMPKLSPDEKEQWLWKTYGLGVMDAKKKFPGRKIRFIHRYWMSAVPDITKHFDGFDEDIQFDFSYKYVKARLYSYEDPKWVDGILKKAPEGTSWWWNLRNDDIFYFRWGDPDFVRNFILNFPPPPQTEGFHMGSDGYVWGREFVSTEPDSPRQLEIDKHWYKFMLWGRLGYDPTLGNDFFERALQQHFPGKPTKKLQEVWARASKIIPAVNREHWHDWDFQWAVETCNSRNGYHKITDKCWKPGSVDVADKIQAHADYVLKNLVGLKAVPGDKTWKRTLGDIEAMAHLGNYYAEKMRAADLKKKNPQQAIVHLKAAARHWENYAAVASAQYKPQLLSKGALADWQYSYGKALEDIELLSSPQGGR